MKKPLVCLENMHGRSALFAVVVFVVSLFAALFTAQAQAAIVYTGATSGANNALPINGTPGLLTIAKPAGTVAGQALIVTVAARPSNMTVTVPNILTWFPMTVTQQPAGGPSTSPGGMTLLTYYHIVDVAAVEPANYTWSFANTIGIDLAHCPTRNPPSYTNCSGGGSAVGGLLAFSGIDTFGSPINVWSALNVNGAPHTTTLITPTVTQTMIVSSISYLSGSSFNFPTSVGGCIVGITERLDQRAPVAVDDIGTTLQMSTGTCTTASATGTVTAVIQPVGGLGADDSGVGHLMALRPSDRDPALSMTRSGPLNPGGTASYTMTVINFGVSPDPSELTIVDTLPPGITFVPTPGPWACSVSVVLGQDVVTCKYTPALPGLGAGATAPLLILNVNISAGVSGTSTNTATVSTASGDGNTFNNTATDSYTYVVDLKILMTRSGPLNPGQNATYTLNVSNVGTKTEPGTITVTETLPLGFSLATPITGTGWTCVVLTCTRPGPLINGASAPPLTVIVTVPANATGSKTNAASVNIPAGESNPADNSATDTYNIVADLVIAITRAGGAINPPTDVAYTVFVSNNGPSDDPGPVIFTSNLAGLIGPPVPTFAGAGWICSFASPVVTCTRNGTLASGASATPLVMTVFVANGTSGAVSTTVTLTTTALDNNTANNSDTDSYTLPLATYAYFKMDEASWTGAANEVLDSSGNNRHGAALGGISTLVTGASAPKGDTCRGTDIPDNNAKATIEAVNTEIDINSLGNAGTISFWYRARQDWNTGGGNDDDRTLFDATDDAGNGEFWMVLRDDGSLRFRLDNAGNSRQTIDTGSFARAAGTWVHVAATWSFTAGRMCVYVDGVSAGCTNSGNITSTNNYAKLYVGDHHGVFTNSVNRGNSADGSIDELRLYSSALTAAQIATDRDAAHSCFVFDHLRIKHDGEGSTCASEDITVEACANAACSSLVTTGVAGTLQPFGTTINIGVSGTQTLSVSPSTAGTNTLSATGVAPAPANVSSCLNTVSGTAICSMLVSACPGGANFNCLETSITPYPIPPSTGQRLYTKLAGTAFSFDVVALNSAGAVETNYVFTGATAKNVTVELVDGSGATACDSRTAISPAVSQPLSFAATDSGRKTSAGMTVSKAYADLRCRVTDTATGRVGCSSDDFSVRPGAVTIAPNPAMPAPPSASSGSPIKTGASFTLRAATTTAATDAYAGSLSQDATKFTAQDNQDVFVASGGVVGTLSPTSLTANATPTNNASYDEVGYLYLAAGAYRNDAYTNVDQPSSCAATDSCDCVTSTASDANLADTLSGGKYGCSIGNKATASLGRFIPDHFAVTQGVATPGCGSSFTYFGQDGFATPFTLMAKNSAGATTQNYTGAFARLGLPTWSNFFFTSVSLPAGSTLTASNTAPIGSWSNGSADVIAKHQASRPTALAGETSVVVNAAPVDADGVTMAASQVAPGTPLRFGRLTLSNAFGSEKSDLTLAVQAQYWSGLSWVLSSNDTCTGTVLTAAGGKDAVALSGYVAPLSAANLGTSHVSGFTADGGGKWKLTLTKPDVVVVATGIRATGSVGVCVDLGPDHVAPLPVGVVCSATTSAAMPWLQGRWPPGTSYDNDPSARVTFGIYSPETKKTVHVREQY